MHRRTRLFAILAVLGLAVAPPPPAEAERAEGFDINIRHRVVRTIPLGAVSSGIELTATVAVVCPPGPGQWVLVTLTQGNASTYQRHPPVRCTGKKVVLTLNNFGGAHHFSPGPALVQAFMYPSVLDPATARAEREVHIVDYRPDDGPGRDPQEE